MDSLQNARQKINQIDKQMAELFSERMQAAKEVAEYKKKCGMPIFDAERENALIENNSGYIEDSVIRSYYIDFLKSNMEISKKYQYRLIDGMRVAYSGVKGAFAESAASRIFKQCNAVGYPDFASAYNSVVNGECDCAVLPIENSFAGDVNMVIDIAFDGPLYINGVYDLEVVHNLLVLPGTDKKNIKTIGIRHGEKMYETLLTNEECAHAIDMGNYYRVPCDKRGLNYDKYFNQGDAERNTLTEFNSNNTQLLTVEETKEKIAALSYIQERLSEGK